MPLPIKPPDAGKITLATKADATALATLEPAAFDGGTGTYYGMSNLGWSWWRLLGDYAPVESQAWSAGDVLQVIATGNEVQSFSENLRTSAPLTGVVPAIGTSPVLIDHGQPFTISWIPLDHGDATMLRHLPYTNGICFCDAPDSAGQIVVDANLLKPTPAKNTIRLSRLTISTVTSGNSITDLVGAEVLAGPLTIE